MQPKRSFSTSEMPLRKLLPRQLASDSLSSRHLLSGTRCFPAKRDEPQAVPHTRHAGQTSESTCSPCSSSQTCPAGTSNPTTPQPAQTTSTYQIVTYVLSAIASIVGILVGVFRVYPFIKSRIATLREAGIKPTLKRVIFLEKTLSKYRPLLEPGDRTGSLQAVVSKQEVGGASLNSGTSVTVAAPALLNLSAEQIGHLVHHDPTLFAAAQSLTQCCWSQPSPPHMCPTASSSSTTTSPANSSLASPAALWPPRSQTWAFARSCMRRASWRFFCS